MNNSHELQQTKEAVVKAFKPYGKKAFEYFRQGNCEATLEYFRQNTDLNSPKVRHELRLLGQAINNLALACNHAENIEWAERAYNFALTIHCELLDPYHSEAAITLYNMGLFLRDRRNDLQGAFDYLAYALEIWKVAVRDEPGYMHYLASCLHSLGGIFAEQQQFDRARQNFEQALKLREAALPDGHPDLAQSFADLGTLYMLEGKLEAARSYLRQALDRYKTALGSNDPMTRAVVSALERIEGKPSREDLRITICTYGGDWKSRKEVEAVVHTGSGKILEWHTQEAKSELALDEVSAFAERLSEQYDIDEIRVVSHPLPYPEPCPCCGERQHTIITDEDARLGRWRTALH